MHKEYVLDGSQLTSLESFFDQISETLVPGEYWRRNLDAFDDILRGGFGTPDDGFILRWTHSATSKASLGYPETIRQLERHLEQCHPTNREIVQAQLTAAKEGKSDMVFDWLVEILDRHGPGGEEPGDNVRLMLE